MDTSELMVEYSGVTLTSTDEPEYSRTLSSGPITYKEIMAIDNVLYGVTEDDKVFYYELSNTGEYVYDEFDDTNLSNLKFGFDYLVFQDLNNVYVYDFERNLVNHINELDVGEDTIILDYEILNDSIYVITYADSQIQIKEINL